MPHAPYNIGIATGPSGLVVVDLDLPKHPDDTPPAEWAIPGVNNGADVLAVLCERHRQPYPDDTHTVRTWSGGTHLYFAAPEGTPRWTLAPWAGSSSPRAGPSAISRTRPCATTSWRRFPGWLTELLRLVPLPPQQPVTVVLASDRRGKWLRAETQTRGRSTSRSTH
ncbi:bifunctional DNA primase/polymerase [Streptomyces sp. NBC_00322]|uniref:bifunctional DNA primase/polymerase n=1 Tax=Streptomyces sp. NBC_00322 TaxID=2975712 RepID=UPI003FA6C27F